MRAVITPTEAAKKMGITRNWLYTLIAMGRIGATWANDRWCIPSSEIEKYLRRKNGKGQA